MYTIYDYLKYYKDYSFKDLKWNMMDNLFIAILTYVPLQSFEYKNYDDLVSEIINHKDNKFNDIMSPKVIELIEIVKESKRYKSIKFKNFINRLDDKTQFGALTVLIENVKVIAFKGTDRSVIGWLENFRASYMYPTHTQSLAINYLNENIGVFDRNVYVTGHSKGGNLAIISSMELSNLKYKKINKIINFDGPGVKYDQFISEKYKRLKGKLINIIPSGSYIGTLMFNQNYQVIKSNTHGVGEHFPTNWNIFGTEFINDNLKKLSAELIKRTSNNIKDIDDNKLKEIFENAFKVYSKRETTEMKMTITDAFNILKNVSRIESEVSKYISIIINTITKINKDL